MQNNLADAVSPASCVCGIHKSTETLFAQSSNMHFKITAICVALGLATAIGVAKQQAEVGC